MSTKCDLLLNNGEIEMIDLDDTNFTYEELKYYAMNRKLICHGNHGECKARLNVIKHHNGKLFFSKFSVNSEEHILNCDRQKVIRTTITGNSITRLKDFLVNLFNGVLEHNEDEEVEQDQDDNETGYGGSGRRNYHGSRSSLNLRKLSTLIRAISNGEINVDMEISDNLKLFDFFRRITNVDSIERFRNNGSDRYFYIFFDELGVTSTNNFCSSLRKMIILKFNYI